MSPNFTLHPRFGRLLSILVAAALVAAFTLTITQGQWRAALQLLPIFALVAVITWATFWRPAVIVTGSGVTVRNVLRSVTIAWPEIRRIDTKYALTLETTHGTVSAWAAPAPGRHSVLSAVRQDGTHLPESSYLAGTVRPGDLITADSGQAAYLIRSHWERLRDDGFLDAATSEFTRLRVTWHWRTMGVIVGAVTVVVIAAAVYAANG
ncbi:MAG: PH domain-containing protein [Rhodoglobus sp.]